MLRVPRLFVTTMASLSPASAAASATPATASSSSFSSAVAISAEALAKIAAIEKRVQTDPGNRGIGAFTLPPGELARQAASLYRLRGTREAAAVVTGFPCLLDLVPPTETDGPLGAVALARAFLAATKAAHEGDPEPSVVLLTDDCNGAVMAVAVEAAGLAADPRCSLQVFPPGSCWGSGEAARFAAVADACATVVAIERAGPGADGGSYTMRAFNMAHLLAPLERLLTPATRDRGDGRLALETCGIGDGGNEVGMGKVRAAILTSTVPHAEKVCAAVAADHLLVCGVSNWGGFALGASLAVLRSAEDACDGDVFPEDEARAACFARCCPTDAEDQAILDAMVGAGCRDGCSKLQESTVDGMPFEASLAVTRDIKAIAIA
jgi:hypothetical protein